MRGGRKEKGAAAALKTDRIRNLTHKHAHDNNSNNNNDKYMRSWYIPNVCVCKKGRNT